MLRRYVWAFAVVAVAGISFWAGNVTRDYVVNIRDIGDFATLFTLPTLTATGDATPFPVNATSSAVADVVDSTGWARVLALTPTSITIHTGFNESKTFAISADTPVYSIVQVGTAGEGMSSVAVGDNMNAYFKSSNPAVAMYLAFPIDPSFALTNEETINTVSGTVLEVTSAQVTIAPASGGAPVTIVLTPTTKILATVAAEQTVQAIAVGNIVAAGGLATMGADTTAKTILIAPAN